MNSVVCADGHMEKQEMEMKWKLETKMERQTLSCCSPSKMRVLLAFIPDHPRALPMHLQFLIAPFVSLAFCCPQYFCIGKY